MSEYVFLFILFLSALAIFFWVTRSHWIDNRLYWSHRCDQVDFIQIDLPENHKCPMCGSQDRKETQQEPPHGV